MGAKVAQTVQATSAPNWLCGRNTHSRNQKESIKYLWEAHFPPSKNQFANKPLTSHRSQKNRQANPKFSEWFHGNSAHSHDSVHRLWSRSWSSSKSCYISSSSPLLVQTLFLPPFPHVSSITWTDLSGTEHIDKWCEKEALLCWGQLMW